MLSSDSSLSNRKQSLRAMSLKNLKCYSKSLSDFDKTVEKLNTVDSDKKFYVAVDNLSFIVKWGEVFWFLGANSARKSTAFKMIFGYTHSLQANATSMA